MINVDKETKDKKANSTVEKSQRRKVAIKRMMILEEKPRNEDLRVIKTARGIKAINDALDKGFMPLIKEVEANERIYVTDVLIRDKETGKFETMAYSYHAVAYGTSENREIIMKKRHYPYKSIYPFAAYLIPDDLKKGERVFIEDIIEDIRKGKRSHSVYRLNRSAAVWDGEEFKIDEVDFFANYSIG